MSILQRTLLLAALALAFLGSAAGATISANTHLHASQIHVMADATPNVTGCGGGSSSFCG